MTNAEIYQSLFLRLKEIVDSSQFKAETMIISIFGDIDPKKNNIFCLFNVAFGEVSVGEFGYYGASQRASVMTINVSINDIDKLDEALELTEILEKGFRKYQGIDGITFEEPYTTTVGKTEDERFNYLVTVPLTTWTYNK